MKKFFILLGLIVLLSASVLAADVNKVGDWWGTVTINGNTGNNGAMVSAYIDSVKVASATVGQHLSAYYLIHVEGESGDEILFKVNGKDAISVYWSSGDHRLDLNVNISSDDDSSGGSSGGGGGSSSSGSSSGGTTSTSSGSSSTSEEKENETININETEESSSTSFLTGAVTGLGEFTKSPNGIASIVLLVVICGAVLFFKFRKKIVKEAENHEEEKEESSEDKEEDSSKEESENNSEEETNEENQNA